MIAEIIHTVTSVDSALQSQRKLSKQRKARIALSIVEQKHSICTTQSRCFSRISKREGEADTVGRA